MADDFTAMADAAQAFFAELRENNDRAWFQARKDRYEAEIGRPAGDFADVIARSLGALTGQDHGAKIFRIYRDVRFSKDKSPYNPWLHILWTETGAPDVAPAFFFSADADGVSGMVGAMGFKGAALTRWRELVDRRGDDLTAALAAAGARLSDYGPAPLKRVPPGYDPDHPHADLLRRKAVIAGGPVDPGFRDDAGLVEGAMRHYTALMPLRTLLREGLC
ncbi:TIGR02453 family protein [Rhodobacteraceae bacterium CCMM004]|nr:TIGR02453 family protein [Rhodobacteraceae bacterium CCMM004]